MLKIVNKKRMKFKIFEKRGRERDPLKYGFEWREGAREREI